MSYYTNAELKELGFKAIGSNVKVSTKTSIYSPETITLGSNVRIDDFCILSGGEKGINIGSYIHIAAFCAIFGNSGVEIKSFSGLSSRVVLYSESDDYSGEYLTNPTIPREYLDIHQGKILLNKHVIIGTNSTILPGVNIGEGTAVGAHSLVHKSLDEWKIYNGSPLKRIGERKRDLLKFEEDLISKFDS